MVLVIKVAASESVRAIAKRSVPEVTVSEEAYWRTSLHNHTHDISLRTDCYQSVNVLANGHQNLASHVAALLCAGCLVLDVNASRALLDEKLGELHDRCKTSMTSVGICDQRPQEVCVGYV
jgi:hypothetical protein